jgi:ABC-type lipoprotein release transport system permease subunit
MNTWLSLQTAWRSLRVNKTRSVLTILGVIVGVAAVVCMVSIGLGAQAQISERIQTLGANLLLVTPRQYAGGVGFYRCQSCQCRGGAASS